MPEILLTTLNARYQHASFGLRYLLANLGDLKDRAGMREFEINQRPLDVVEQILREEPRIVGIGVYIWNVEHVTSVVANLKRLRPNITIILGGPEVSHEVEQQRICQLADYVVTGEGDLAFAELCRSLLNGRRPLMKVIPADLPEFEQKTRSAGFQPAELNEARGQDARATIALPYDLYTDEDLAHRVAYVEASRGCPFSCEFCLSSLDVPVRNVPVEMFLPEMKKLLDRGLRQFKFVDRTFNLNLKISQAILKFFLDNWRDDLFLHFEMIPDRLPEALRELIKRFPPGALQFEVGIQTFNEDVSGLISRRQDNKKIEDNFKFLREETGVHIHADLIVGLPGEDLESFARGLDKLVGLKPQEIQVGILKRLRGTPIVRHDAEWGMIYSPNAPYEILATKLIDFGTMQRMRRFSRYWDLIANSGNFVNALPMVWEADSPFASFMQLSDWLYATTKQTHAISLSRLTELLERWLVEEARRDPARVRETMKMDEIRLARVKRRQEKHLVTR